jgi:hypothetical protein
MTQKNKPQPYLDLLGKIDTLDTQVNRMKDQLTRLKALIAGGGSSSGQQEKALISFETDDGVNSQEEVPGD